MRRSPIIIAAIVCLTALAGNTQANDFAAAPRTPMKFSVYTIDGRDVLGKPYALVTNRSFQLVVKTNVTLDHTSPTYFCDGTKAPETCTSMQGSVDYPLNYTYHACTNVWDGKSTTTITCNLRFAETRQAGDVQARLVAEDNRITGYLWGLSDVLTLRFDPNAKGFDGTLAATGPLAGRSIETTVVPASGDVGQQGRIYVAADVPGSGLYFLAPAGWQRWTAGTIPAYQTGALPASLTVPAVSNADLSGIVGAQIYIGYGVGSDAATAESSLVNQKDDLGNARYKRVYTVQ